MTGWFAPSPALQRLLPGGKLRGPTLYVLAIMTFVMMIVASAGLAIANASGIVSSAASNRQVVQLPDADGQRLLAAIAAARSVPGVRDVEPVSERDMRRTLERWLGPAALDASLPIPALIHLDVAPGTSTAEIAKRVASAAPGARLISEAATVQPLLRSLRVLEWLALGVVMLMAAATSAAVVLAARGALDTHRFTIEVMHGIGATDRQIAELFQRKIALDALIGSFAGGTAAALVLILVAGAGATLSSDLSARPPLDSSDLLLLALMPLLAVALATLVARVAVLRALRQAP